MLHINDLTYRIGERLLIDGATVALPTGAHVGLVGRNGAGKTTLFRLIAGETRPGNRDDHPAPRRAHRPRRAGGAGRPAKPDRIRAGGRRRARELLSEAETATDPLRIAEIQTRLADIDAHAAPARAARILSGLGFDEAAQQRALSEFSGGWRMRVALAAVLFSAPDLLLLDEPTNYLDLEGALWLVDYLQHLSRDRARHQPRSRPARRRRQPHPASRPRQADVMERRLFAVRAPARRTDDPAGQGGQEAGGAAQAPAVVRRPLPRQRDQGAPGAVAHQNAGADGSRSRRSSTTMCCRSAGLRCRAS